MRSYILNIFYYKLKLKYFWQLYYKLKILFFILSHSEISYILRTRASWMFSLNLNNISIAKLINICLFSGKSRAVFTRWNLNRFVLKKYANSGSLLNVSRNSW